jgi:hypothetical protein
MIPGGTMGDNLRYSSRLLMVTSSCDTTWMFLDMLNFLRLYYLHADDDG